MSKATLKFVRLSPNKARLIAREVQGMNAEIALASLDFMPNKAAGIISKVIASAVANGDYEPEEVKIISCRVDKGPVLRRFKPRARGSASRILKPTSHIMVEVGESSTDLVKTKKVEKVEKKKPTKSIKEKKDSTLDSKDKETKDKSPAPSQKKSSQDASEDLKQLSGIGPVMEKKLNAEGITTVSQVAKLTKEQIAQLDAKIGIKGKIEDTWQSEAKEILKNSKKES